MTERSNRAKLPRISMIVCVLWAGVSSLEHAPIFAPEALAIFSFAVSWLVKSAAHQSMIEGAKRLLRGRPGG